MEKKVFSGCLEMAATMAADVANGVWAYSTAACFFEVPRMHAAMGCKSPNLQRQRDPQATRRVQSGPTEDQGSLPQTSENRTKPEQLQGDGGERTFAPCLLKESSDTCKLRRVGSGTQEVLPEICRFISTVRMPMPRTNIEETDEYRSCV